MKKIWKRNQLIVTALVILVGVAGYLNFTEQSVKETLNWTVKESDKEKALEQKELVEVDVNEEEENEKDEKTEVGEAVLTNASVKDSFYEIKLAREQTRAENKEMLTEILNNKNATDDQKNEAVNSIMQLTDFSEKENEAETLLNAKGFEGAVVSMGEKNVDVVVNKEKLEEQDIVQIEDIVSRKTGVSMEKIIISTNKK